MTQAIYLFALAQTEQLDSLQQLIERDPSLLLQSVATVVALYTWVPLAEFCGTEAETRMQDLTWLLPRIQRHEQMIQQAIQYSPVLPARFATLFSTLDSLIHFLTQQAININQFLTEIAHKQEWAVKGLLNRTTTITTLVNQRLAQSSDLLADSPGKRYFQERQLHREVEQYLQTWLKQTCNDILSELQQKTTHFAKRRILSSHETESHREVIVNWAFLLSTEQLDDFFRKIEEINAQCADLGLSFECSGPWAPYSFSHLSNTLNPE